MVSVCREILCVTDTMTAGMGPGLTSCTGKVADFPEVSTIEGLYGEILFLLGPLTE